MNLLLVEDDDANAQIITDFCAMYGHECQRVKSLEEFQRVVDAAGNGFTHAIIDGSFPTFQYSSFASKNGLKALRLFRLMNGSAKIAIWTDSPDDEQFRHVLQGERTKIFDKMQVGQMLKWMGV